MPGQTVYSHLFTNVNVADAITPTKVFSAAESLPLDQLLHGLFEPPFWKALRMDSTMGRISSSMMFTVSQPRRSLFGFKGRQQQPMNTIHALSNNGHVSRSFPHAASRNAVEDALRQRSSLESRFCYDKAVPEEIIETPVGLSLAEKRIGDNPSCPDCQAKGAVLCRTCSGSGLYVDSILESQGIIVKVRCLGCGGTGNILCLECGGRGHVHLK